MLAPDLAQRMRTVYAKRTAATSGIERTTVTLIKGGKDATPEMKCADDQCHCGREGRIIGLHAQFREVQRKRSERPKAWTKKY